MAEPAIVQPTSESKRPDIQIQIPQVNSSARNDRISKPSSVRDFTNSPKGPTHPIVYVRYPEKLLKAIQEVPRKIGGVIG